MKRSIAVVAAILTVSLGLLASAPADAGGGYGHGYQHGFKHGYGHGYKHAYRHGHHKRHAYRHRHHKRHAYRRHHSHADDGDKFLAAAGIIAGAKVISAYLERPPAYQPAPVYAAPVQPRPCYQVMVPYADGYGGYYYVPQVQCY